LRAAPVLFADRIEGIIIIFQDLSKQEAVRREKENLQQRALLGEVTASFAHEVRSPINNIFGRLQNLESKLASDDPNQENIRLMMQDCKRLDEMIKTGLYFIKPMEYKMEAVDLEALLTNLLERQLFGLNRHKIQLALYIAPGLPEIEGDPRALEQVFINLINNAIDAMCGQEDERTKVLGVRASVVSDGGEKDLVEVKISDTGPGIPENIRSRVFEPFFTTKAGGSGIGLALVKRIVTAHKGSVIPASVPGGTVFSVRLPAKNVGAMK
jgi:two-component system sensor histidine kinase AtoS